MNNYTESQFADDIIAFLKKRDAVDNPILAFALLKIVQRAVEKGVTSEKEILDDMIKYPYRELASYLFGCAEKLSQSQNFISLFWEDFRNQQEAKLANE